MLWNNNNQKLLFIFVGPIRFYVISLEPIFFFLYIQRKLLLWVEVISLKAANEMRTSYDSYFM